MTIVIGEILKVEVHGCAVHVMDCPLKMREYNNTYYANLIDDCNDCEHFKRAIPGEDTSHEFIICSGKQ